MYQVWSPTQRQLILDEARQALTTAEVIQLLTDMKLVVCGDTVSPFHATRPLQEHMNGQVLTMVMDISFRAAKANELYGRLEQLQGLAALQICGVQFRKEGYKRSPGAQRLLELTRTARLVGALTLRNPSNYCYMNVSVRGLLWAMLPWLDSAVHFTKSGREALRLLLQHNNQSVFIYGTPIWRMLLHRWEAASSQHDASEFLAFLLSKLCTPMVTWRWEARLITDADCEVLDRGDSMQANHCFTRGMLRLTCMPWQAMRSCYFFGWLVTGSEQAA